jgi:hypothetical protein
MKRLLLVLVVLAAVSLIATGCQKSSHDRYREWTYRRVIEAEPTHAAGQRSPPGILGPFA